jgi:hypothetical protein
VDANLDAAELELNAKTPLRDPKRAVAIHVAKTGPTGAARRATTTSPICAPRGSPLPSGRARFSNRRDRGRRNCARSDRRWAMTAYRCPVEPSGTGAPVSRRTLIGAIAAGVMAQSPPPTRWPSTSSSNGRPTMSNIDRRLAELGITPPAPWTLPRRWDCPSDFGVDSARGGEAGIALQGRADRRRRRGGSLRHRRRG